MKRSEILRLVYDAILHRPANAGRWWRLCWEDGKIQCLPYTIVHLPEIIFQTVNDAQLRNGLDTTEWAELEAKIYTFLKEKGLCQIQ